MAAQTVVAGMRVTLNITETLSTGLANSVAASDLVTNFQWVAGNSATANGINQYFANGASAITLNASANTTITLTAMTDASGSSRSLANGVKGLLIYTTSRVAGQFLTIGNAAANTWTGFVSVNTTTLKVFDFLALGAMSTDSHAVNSTSNQLKITNTGANAITFKLAVWGNT